MTNPRDANPKAPKLTDAERHKRFVDMAKEVAASEDPEDFDRVFAEVAKAPEPKPET